MDKYAIDSFDEKIMEAFIIKTKQSDAKIDDLEQSLKVKEAELEYVANLYDKDKKILTLELEKAAGKLVALEDKFNEVKHSNSIKAEEIENLNNNSVELNAKIAAKDEEINNLKTEITDLNGKLSSRDKEVSELNKEVVNIEEIRKEIPIKEKLIEEQSTTIKEIEAELNELKPPEILNDDTTSGDRLICAKCGAVGKDIKTIEDKSKPLSYGVGNMPMYAKYNICKKCGNQF